MATTVRSILPHLLALLSGFALMQMGNTLQGTLLSVRGDIEGFSPAQIGAIGASFWAGIVIGSLNSNKIIERVGHPDFCRFGGNRIDDTAPPSSRH